MKNDKRNKKFLSNFTLAMGFLLNRLQTTLHTIENVLNGSESFADNSINYVMGFEYHVLCNVHTTKNDDGKLFSVLFCLTEYAFQGIQFKLKCIYFNV